MKKKKNTDTFDKKLQDWGARTQPGAAHLRQLQERVMRDTRETLHAQHDPSEMHVQEHNLRRPTVLGWTSLGVAASALILGVSLWSTMQENNEMRSVEQDKTIAVPFDAEQIAARQIIFSELDALFAGTLRWVTLQDDAFSFDFNTEPVRKQDAPVALRTVVSKRSPETHEWIPLFHADILLPTDEYVSLEKPDLPHSQLGLWVHRLPDGNYIVQTDIQEAEYPSDSQMLKFQAGSSAAEVVSMKTGNTQYRISQSLAVLTPEGRNNET